MKITLNEINEIGPSSIAYTYIKENLNVDDYVEISYLDLCFSDGGLGYAIYFLSKKIMIYQDLSRIVKRKLILCHHR